MRPLKYKNETKKLFIFPAIIAADTFYIVSKKILDLHVVVLGVVNIYKVLRGCCANSYLKVFW